MHRRALASRELTLAFFESGVRQDGNDLSVGAHDRRAQSLGLRNWQQLLQFVDVSAILLDKHRAQYTVPLATNVETAWAYVSEPKKLSSWAIPVEFEPKLGGRFQFSPPEWYGTLGVYDEGKAIRFDSVKGGWTALEVAGNDKASTLILRDYLPPEFELPASDKDGPDAHLFNQPGGKGTHWHGVLAGWHSGLSDLRNRWDSEVVSLDYATLTTLYDLLIRDYHRD